MDTFRRILFDSSSCSTKTLKTLYADLCANNFGVGSFLSSEMARVDLVTKFPTVVNNLLRLLDVDARPHAQPSQSLARELLELVGSILLHAEFDLVDPAHLERLLIAAIRYGLPFRHSHLHIIATRLAEKTGLLERILASPHHGSEVMVMLLMVHFVRNKPLIVNSWAGKLCALCSACTKAPECHGFQSDVQMLHELTCAMKVIDVMGGEDWDERHHPHWPMPESVSLPDHITGAINEIQLMPLPSADNFEEGENENLKERREKRLEKLREQIRDLEIPIIRKVLSKYPCSVCYQITASLKERTTQSQQLQEDSDDSDLSMVPVKGVHEALFGGKIGRWRVLLSAHAFKDIQRQFLAGSIDLLQGRVRRLASGDWKGGNLFKLAKTDSGKKYMGSPLLLAKVGKKLRILWQIVAGCGEDGVYSQQIKIWRVIRREDVSKAIEQVVMVYRNQTRGVHQDMDIPWRANEDATGLYIPSEVYVENAASQEYSACAPPPLSVTDRHVLENYNKFYQFTEPMMKSFLDKDLFAEFPLDTSPEEIEVINYIHSSTLIFGRSGTGKTTCLVQKLLRSYMFSRSVMGQTSVRQVLLTRSRFLAEKLRSHTKRLIESQLPNRKTPGQLTLGQPDPLEYSLAADNVIFSKTLLTLTNDDFPLVCTFDQLLTLLENTVAYFTKQDSSHPKSRLPPSNKTSAQYVRRPQVVDFMLFRSEYWKQFLLQLSKSLEPGLVFSEIMGIIKGSATTKASLNSLSRDEYLTFSHRKAPAFSRQQRVDVYELYTRYERLKHNNQDKDDIDRVVSLLRFLKAAQGSPNSVEGWFEELYVDEVQDQRCIDIGLLLKLVGNPRNIHFAGDTAQCISKDSTFRFNDVKMLFYEQFSQFADAKKDKSLAVPAMFALNQNFRSHQGIISLASFVMRLLYLGFPQHVDQMDEEKGRYSGPIPTLFVGVGVQDLGSHIGEMSEIELDFGAEQVILVRDDIVKERLQSKIGETALVLTILESKGMEFDDVFLVDFFTTSPCAQSLRKFGDILTSGSCSVEGTKSGILCSELKHLYVAITRARNHLWVFETSPKAVDPIVRLWVDNPNAHGPLVDVMTKSHPNIREKLGELKPAVPSDPERYVAMGGQLLIRRLFREANMCFRKAGDERGQKISMAHMKIVEGHGHRARGSYREFMASFSEAVLLFREFSQLENAAFCLEEMNCLEEAGDIWLAIERHDKAATLFEQAQSWLKAFSSYDQLGCRGEAAAALRQGEFFDELVRYLAANRREIDPVLMAGYCKLCTILLSQGRISADLENFILDSIGTEEEKEEFFRKCRLKKQLVEALSNKCDYGKAFQELLSDGRIPEALEIGLAHIHQFSSISARDVIMLLHYSETSKLRALFSGTRDDQSSISAPQPSLPRQVSAVVGDWASLLQQTREIMANRRCTYDSLELDNELLKDILCITITLYRPTVVLSGCIHTIGNLLFIAQALTRAASLWCSMFEGRPIPLPIAIAFGVFPQKETSAVTLCSDSPLRPLPQNPGEAAELTKICKKVLLEKMLSLYEWVDEVARTHWQTETRLCTRFIHLGHCGREGCQNRHEQLSRDRCKTRIEELAIISSLFCSFDKVHLVVGRVIEPFGSHHPRRRRYWLENLLSEITFRSAFEHDSEAIPEVFRKITAQNTEFSAIYQGLSSLLFHRIDKKREWATRNDISSLLEAVQLAQNLGSAATDRFVVYISRNVFKPYVGDPPPPALKSWRTYCAVRDFREALQCAKSNSPMDFTLYTRS
ncbi:P-loop containing nucleoside triphosphate hydrolase protein [Wilcoxina mikolae CBS 423.85]|nr:P-loop containing nucleoside triphosphate hydrolase protein [Wilcoxina mikolae CBS 423.85]